MTATPALGRPGPGTSFGVRPIATEPDTSHGVILYVEGVTVSFDGFKALDDLNLYIDDGELRCIIGPNGAGKSTLLDVITGKTRPDQGKAFFGQTIDLLQLDRSQIARAGIGRKFQKPTMFENHSVFENLELALKGNKGVWHSLFTELGPGAREQVDQTLETIHLQDHASRAAAQLSHGQKQWLEIGMLLMQSPRVLLLDEPVAGMSAAEIEQTAELFTSLAGERTVVVIEHDMEFVRTIADRVTVLHEGRVLADGSMQTVQNDPRVIEVYLGDETC